MIAPSFLFKPVNLLPFHNQHQNDLCYRKNYYTNMIQNANSQL